MEWIDRIMAKISYFDWQALEDFKWLSYQEEGDLFILSCQANDFYSINSQQKTSPCTFQEEQA